jgi:hypothetical protein
VQRPHPVAVLDQQEQGRLAVGELLAHALHLVVVDADVAELGEQPAGGGAQRTTDQRPTRPEEQPGQDPDPGPADRALRGGDVLGLGDADPPRTLATIAASSS